MSNVSNIGVALTIETRRQEPAELQLLWAEGLSSGPGKLGSMDEIKREARRRLNAAPSA